MRQRLRQAASVFSVIVDRYPDGSIVGHIRNVPIYAGEVRRLSAALEADPADDGPEVEILTRR